MSNDTEIQGSYLYYPGVDEGGAGESYMTDSYHSLILKGREVIASTFGGTPKRMAELRDDGLWWDVSDEFPDEPRVGHPVVYIEASMDLLSEDIDFDPADAQRKGF